MSEIIGERFEIGDLVGQGGMATVYSGKDIATGQKVAIKLLKPDVIAADPDIVERFSREGEALRRLNHPNIVKVLATIEKNERHYVVMEYVGGGDLNSLLDQYRAKEERIPIARILEIALDLSDALTRAHRLKIIHRDIKPANVLLAEDGTPRLTDFGVAHFGDATRMTQTGAMIGTLAYLSPEACSGMELDARADIWAFGVMLYEMLTLRRPFQESNTAALLTAILSKQPESLAALRPDAPPALVTLVEQMMLKEHEARIPSARIVGAQIEAISSGKEPPTYVTPTPTPTTEQHVEHPPMPQPIPLSEGQRLGSTMQQTKPAVSGVRPMNRLALGGVAAVILVVLLILAIGVLPSLIKEGDSPESNIVIVEPVAENEYMVLVAAMEHVGGAERDVSRFIVDDLTQKFEEDVLFSDVRIRAYPDIITSKEQAREIAEANGAAVIIWGNYDDESVNIEVQLGSLAVLTDNPFPREELERITDVRILMTNERHESLVVSVVAIIEVLYSINLDNYGIARDLAILDMVEDTAVPEVIGNSVAANWHRHLASFAGDTIPDLETLNAAISLDARQPLFYLARTLVYEHLGRFDEVYQDFATVRQIAPESWLLADLTQAQHEIFFGGDLQQAIELLDTLLAQRPDEWWWLTMSGIAHYQLGDIDQARETLRQAIAQEPPANFPYIFAVAIALRDGNLIEATDLLRTVQTRFPDPTFGPRLLRAAYGLQATDNVYASSVEAFGYFVLRQWDEVVRATGVGLAMENTIPDLYVLQGFAYCNLGDYASAEASYTQLINIAPDYVLPYALRAEVRQKQNNPLGAMADVALVLQSPQAEQFTPLLPVFQSGELSCENFLDYDFTTLATEETP